MTRWKLWVLIAVVAAMTIVPAIMVIVRFFVSAGWGTSNEVRNVGLIFLAVVGAPIVIWRTWIAHDNLDRSRGRDYADLFTKAVEQLGTTREEVEYEREGKDRVERRVLKPNIEVRLGAIYALECISQDSERDHIAVMETLCAYVRENAQGKGCEKCPVTIPKELAPIVTFSYPDERPKAQRLKDWLATLPAPREDVQAAVRVLGRRGSDRIKLERGSKKYDSEHRLDFRCSNLRKYDFEDGEFTYAIFSETLLDGASIDGAAVSHSIFSGASVFGANLSVRGGRAPVSREQDKAARLRERLSLDDVMASPSSLPRKRESIPTPAQADE